MALINFKKEFAEKVRTGEKLQTIRKVRKNPVKPGENLHLYTGLRTKYCVPLGVRKCVSVEPIKILVGGFEEKDEANNSKLLEISKLLNVLHETDSNGVSWGVKIIINDIEIEHDKILEFVKADGFESIKSFAEFFRGDFEGVLIKWEV